MLAAGLLVPQSSLSAKTLPAERSDEGTEIDVTSPMDASDTPLTGDKPAPNDGSPPPAEAAEDDTVIKARHIKNPADPLEVLNAKSFELTQKVDEAVVTPAAKTYESKVPAPLRNGLRNALANLQEPIVILNYALQHNIAKTRETIGRFVINSTIGLAGLFDMARRKPFRLPYHHNGFANTMGFYGVKPGAYLFLPLMGATTVRDVIGDNLDRLLWPSVLGTPFTKPYFAIPAATERTLEHRLAFDEMLEEMRKTRDPYAARRDTYLRTRQLEIDSLHEKHRRRPPPRADDSGAAAGILIH